MVSSVFKKAVLGIKKTIQTMTRDLINKLHQSHIKIIMKSLKLYYQKLLSFL